MNSTKFFVVALLVFAGSAHADCVAEYDKYSKTRKVLKEEMIISGLAAWGAGIALTGGPAFYFHLQAEAGEETAALLREAVAGQAGPAIIKRVKEIVKKNPDQSVPELSQKFVNLIGEGNRSGLLCPPGEFRSADDILDWAEQSLL